jgi:hypothetical protein
MNYAAIHQEIINNGWVEEKYKNKYIYHNSNPYDKLIIEYISPEEVSITVPIPFRDSSISYNSIFNKDDINDIHNYIKLHLSNYKKL